MTFLNLSPLAVAAGLVGLAGLLFALQRLRIRYHEIPVVTNLFWREAAREAPVRVLRQRFRHPLAYLLILAICALLWVGFAGPDSSAEGGDDYYVLYLDGSARMAEGDALDRAVSALREDLVALPLGAREVIWGGADNLKILAPGEHYLLMERRLEALAPEAVPSSIDDQLRLLARGSEGARPVRVVIYGAAPVDAETLARLPEGVTVTRAAPVADLAANRGITRLGVSEAASGDWNKVDVLIGVGARDDATVAREDLELSIDGAPATGLVVEEAAGEALLVRDLDANGAVFQARLSGEDALALDDAARITLPERTQVRVAVSPSVPPRLLDVIAADRGLLLVGAEEADVVLRLKGEALAGGLPALEFAPMAAQESAFDLRYAGDADAETVLRESVAALGLDQIDSAGLATAAARPIGVSLVQGDVRGVSVWAELLGEEFNFTKSRSFPLFVSRSVRWLAGAKPWYPYLAAGRPVADRAADYAIAGAHEPAFDALGAEFVLGASGEVPSQLDDGAVYVSLTSAAVSSGLAGAEIETSSQGIGVLSTGGDLVLWVMLAALGLLLAEWYVYQRGLMP